MALSILSIEAFHRFAYFLSTVEGELFKRFTEFVVYTMLSYMIISEYKRSRRLELKYLSIAFASLMIHRFLLVIIFANFLFTKLNLSQYNFFLPVLLSMLELVTLILLVNAFLFPILQKAKVFLK